MRYVSLIFPLVVWHFLFTPPASANEKGVVEPSEELRRELKLDPFYKKSVIRDGFAVVSSGKVADHALLEAAYLIDQMLAGRADVRKALVGNKVRFAVMAPDEFTTQVP